MSHRPAGDEYIRKAFQTVEAARPASGFCPNTPDEWRRLLHAFEELGYAMYRTGGLPEKDARKLARQTHGGVAGLLLLITGFDEGSNE